MRGRLAVAWAAANGNIAGPRSIPPMWRRTRGRVARPAHDAAVDRSGCRGLSGDQPGGDRRHHHRQFDPGFARARAGRTCDRQLEGICGGAAKPPSVDGFAQAHAAGDAGRPHCRPRAGAWRSKASTLRRPGQQKLVVQDASFTLEAGQGLGIIGPSASGKSSLARGHRRGLDCRRAEKSVWTAPRSSNGHRKGLDRISAICPRISNCSMALSPRTSAALRRIRFRRGDCRSTCRGRARTHRPAAGRL